MSSLVWFYHLVLHSIVGYVQELQGGAAYHPLRDVVGDDSFWKKIEKNVPFQDSSKKFCQADDKKITKE